MASALDLSGRTALVTGSTQGIGLAIATGAAVRVDCGYADAILP